MYACGAKQVSWEENIETSFCFLSFHFVLFSEYVVNFVLNKIYHCGSVSSSCNKGTMYIKGTGLNLNADFQTSLREEKLMGHFPNIQWKWLFLLTFPPTLCNSITPLGFQIRYSYPQELTQPSISPIVSHLHQIHFPHSHQSCRDPKSKSKIRKES